MCNCRESYQSAGTPTRSSWRMPAYPSPHRSNELIWHIVRAHPPFWMYSTPFWPNFYLRRRLDPAGHRKYRRRRATADQSVCLSPCNSRGPKPFRKEPMLVKTSAHSVHVTISCAANLEETLNKAVDILFRTAVANKCGILVTRHSHELYTADVHPSVPFGLTREISM